MCFVKFSALKVCRLQISSEKNIEKICLVTCNTDFPSLPFGLPVLKGLEVFPVMKLPCNLHLLGHPLRQYSDREISAENSEEKKTK